MEGLYTTQLGPDWYLGVTTARYYCDDKRSKMFGVNSA